MQPMRRETQTIHLWPVEGVHALPWPAREWDATPEEWADIQTYIPPPFTDRPPTTVASDAVTSFIQPLTGLSSTPTTFTFTPTTRPDTEA